MSTELRCEQPNQGAPNFIFILLMIIGIPCILFPALTLFIIPLVIFSSFCFFIHYLYSEGHFSEILSGIVIGIIITAVAMIIPIVGPIILVLWIIYNIAKAVGSIKGLVPDAIISILLVASLLIPFILDVNRSPYRHDNDLPERIACAATYIIISAVYYFRMKNYPMTTKDYLFRFSILWISGPLIMLLIMMIAMSIKAAFRITVNTTLTPTTVTQNVSAHMRGETLVSAYTREVTRNIATTTTHVLPGAGAVAASVLGQVAPKIDQSESELIAEALPIKDHEFLLDNTYQTNTDHNFYRYDDFDDKKINNFVQCANAKFPNQHINKNDILFYYNETLFGSGDHGVILTSEYVCCSLGRLYESFIINYADIKHVSIKGSFNKTITILSQQKKMHKIELTQSNKGAIKLYELIREFSL
ncbi:hypothetical protein NVI2019_PEGOAJLN_02281 [Providencia alcalifaciens]|uniref:hypothetical protein n=1 Tax=Providencia TaxID=586 RepID=UPI0004B4FA61|nr:MULTISPECIES: hypothetical protein [Providencia]MBF0690812.1 hypothetical protein [Providencia alcalifaciens]MTC50678.1 hypothetical protein [Providencia alcalifaciens]NYS89316.1 hypothetical protein [Providencia alcalifaciens]CAG9423758.1 hypothetical protein NVI2019_PEGOAJLN_02281 [Providencia alcalifaciens]